MIIFLDQARDILKQFLGLLHPLLLVKAEGRAVLQLDARDDAEGTQRHARGVEQLRLVILVQVNDIALGRDHTQAHHIAGVGTELGAGAMRGGGDRAGQRLVVDVGHVRQRLPDLEQRLTHLLESAR